MRARSLIFVNRPFCPGENETKKENFHSLLNYSTGVGLFLRVQHPSKHHPWSVLALVPTRNFFLAYTGFVVKGNKSILIISHLLNNSMTINRVFESVKVNTLLTNLHSRAILNYTKLQYVISIHNSLRPSLVKFIQFCAIRTVAVGCLPLLL